MSLINKILKGSITLSFGNIATNVLSFVRNIIIARLLSPTDYGIATIFTLTVTCLQMLSNLSAETLLVQADFGDDESFGDMVHFVQLLRGIIAAVVLFLAGGIIAKLFSVPEAQWAFRMLALVPLIRGVLHRDINRFHRDYIFLPGILTENVAGFIATFVAIPLCLTFKNFTAVLWILILHSLTLTAMSHLMAHRRFGLKPSLKYWREIFRFGWPLLVNGLLMFIIFQGDRFVIGAARNLFDGNGYSLEVLGWYSAAFSITLVPSIMIARISQGLVLPALSGVKSEPIVFNRRYHLACQMVSLIITFFVLPFVLGGGHIINIVYGKRYLAAASVIGILAIMQAFRLFRIVPTIAAMAKGDTKNAMIANIVRSCGFVGVLIFAYLGLAPYWIALAGLVGEGAASLTSILRLWRVHDIPASGSIFPAILVLVFLVFSVFVGRAVDYPSSMPVMLISIMVGYVLIFMVNVTLFPAFRKNIMWLYNKRMNS